MKIFKVPSGEITNFSFLRNIGKLKKKVILSTGMANIKEIEDALKVLIKFGTKKRYNYFAYKYCLSYTNERRKLKSYAYNKKNLKL